MSIEFAVGKRVVCVAAEFGRYEPQVPLELHGIYTIRAITECPHNGLGFELEEVRNPIFSYDGRGEEYGYHHSRFRPVRETSIDCFTKLLEKQPELVGGNA